MGRTRRSCPTRMIPREEGVVPPGATAGGDAGDDIPALQNHNGPALRRGRRRRVRRARPGGRKGETGRPSGEGVENREIVPERRFPTNYSAWVCVVLTWHIVPERRFPTNYSGHRATVSDVAIVPERRFPTNYSQPVDTTDCASIVPERRFPTNYSRQYENFTAFLLYQSGDSRPTTVKKGWPPGSWDCTRAAIPDQLQ